MKRFLSLTIFLILALTASLRAENAVRFSNATVQPGGKVSVEILIENDVLLGGATVPFRWSSPDLIFDSVIVRPERWEQDVNVIYQQTNFAERFSAVTFIRSLVQGETGWIPAGDGSIATLHFSVKPTAQIQYAFIDSVYHVNNGQPFRWVNWSTYQGAVIAPVIYPGTITIGTPAAVTMRVAPTSVTLASNSGAASPVTTTLQIQSESAIDFDWSASWSSNWLRLAPSVGKTPAYPSVSADAFFLLEGTYFDTLVISSNLAENSPIEVPVTFVVDTAIVIPPEEPDVSLYQNRPSPFDASRDPNTRIPFKLKRAEHVEIAIFDILGRRIKTLTSAQYGEGEAAVEWDGRTALGEAAASGHYICRMSTASGEQSRVIVLIR